MAKTKIKTNMTDSQTKQVFVLLYYFWEGDDYLVNSFQGVFSSEEKALIECTKTPAINVYGPEDTLPKEDEGNYHTTPFYHIKREVIQ